MSNIVVGSPQSVNTLAGLIRMNDRNLTDWSVSDILAPTQFQNALPWFAASNGTQHKFTVETALPGSAFRLLNNGVANAAGQEKTVTADLKLIDASYDDVDVALATENIKGGRDAYLMKRGMRSLTSALVRSEYSLIQGTDFDAAGPDGLAQLVSLYNLAYNGGGAGGTRVYMLITGESDVCGILGQEGRFDVSAPFMTRKVTNAGTGAAYGAWAQNINGWVCLQVGGKYSAAVGYNFDGTTGHKVNDDALAEIYSLFPSDRAPRVNLILMSRIGLKQLQQSRTATTPTGAYAAYPTFWNGAGRDIPIVISDAVNDAEATVTTTTTTSTTTTTAG